MNRNKKGQFAKETPYSLASLCGFIVIVAGISLIGLNLYRQNKKIEHIEEIQEQQIEQIEEVKEEVVEVKEIVEEIKATIGKTDEQRKVEIEIRKIAKEKNFKWPDYLVRLAYCESRLNPANINTRGNKPATSKDRGLFQWNDYWNKHITDECAFDLRCSTEKTIEKINAGGQGIWVCNRIILSEK